MDDGNLNNVHPDVIDVRFVGRLDETGIPSEVDGGSNVLIPPDGPAKNNSHSSSNQVRAWPWSLLALGITTICVCIYLYRNRRRNQLDDNSFREDATNAPETPTISRNQHCRILSKTRTIASMLRIREELKTRVLPRRDITMMPLSTGHSRQNLTTSFYTDLLQMKAMMTWT